MADIVNIDGTTPVNQGSNMNNNTQSKQFAVFVEWADEVATVIETPDATTAFLFYDDHVQEGTDDDTAYDEVYITRGGEVLETTIFV